MKYVDENGNAISKPDWSLWFGVRTEEVVTKNEDGTNTIEVVMHCQMYTDEELAYKAEIDRQKRIMDQTPIALQLCIMQANLPDEAALKVEALYPEWVIGNDYATGDIRRYKEKLYRSLQPSTAASEHTPDVAVSLWKEIKEPDESGVLPWVQPLGATDAYMTGDRVSYNGVIYVSVVDNNVWEPGTNTSLWIIEN